MYGYLLMEKLALDVGGAHGEVTGTLDFKNLEAKVSKVKKSAASGDAGEEGTDKTTGFTLKGDKQDEHTLTMFYMERGMWESNMMIAFNFPDDNEFAVEKQVDKREVNPLFVDSFEDASVFPFTIQNQADPIGYEDAIAAAGLDAVRGRQGGDAMSPWSHAYDIAGHQTDWTVIRKSTRR